MEKALIVFAIIIGMAIFIGILWRVMMDEPKTIHLEKVIRVCINRRYYASEINYHLGNGWKVKYPPVLVTRDIGEDYMEYVIYKDEPIKKGES